MTNGGHVTGTFMTDQAHRSERVVMLFARISFPSFWFRIRTWCALSVDIWDSDYEFRLLLFSSDSSTTLCISTFRLQSYVGLKRFGIFDQVLTYLQISFWMAHLSERHSKVLSKAEVPPTRKRLLNPLWQDVAQQPSVVSVPPICPHRVTWRAKVDWSDCESRRQSLHLFFICHLILF